MQFTDLPLEIIVEIVTLDYDTWKHSVIAMPGFTMCIQKYAQRKFRKISTVTTATKHITRIFVNNKLHNCGGPAVVTKLLIDPDKFTEQWYCNDELHRPDTGRHAGPAYIDHINSQMIWYQHGVKHRIQTGQFGGPASMNFEKYEFKYYRKGELHNDNGPAVITAKYMVYFTYDKFVRAERIEGHNNVPLDQHMHFGEIMKLKIAYEKQPKYTNEIKIQISGIQMNHDFDSYYDHVLGTIEPGEQILGGIELDEQIPVLDGISTGERYIRSPRKTQMRDLNTPKKTNSWFGLW